MASAAPVIDEDVGTHIPGEEPPARNYETEARERGWVPKEEFKGDPSRCVDAKTFVERTDEVMPLLKADRDRYKRELAEVRRDARRLVEHFTKAEERIRAELTEKMEAAVESGDLEAFRRAKTDADALNKEVSEKASSGSADDAREAFDTWREENAWYDRANLASAGEIEVSARLYADRMVEKYIEKTKDMPPAEFFGFIGDLVKEKYPMIGAKPARIKPPSDVAGTTGIRPATRGKGWADMEPEERRIAERLADKWVKSGILKSKDDYLKSYDWTKK